VRTVLLIVAAVIATGVGASQADRSLAPASLLEENTLLAIYGRGFGVSPILGRLGCYRGIDEMAADVCERAKAIAAVNDGKGVVQAIHLIYAMAIPCKAGSDCLLYLGPDLVRKYVEPAAERGWAVILDSQLGRSTPVEQVRRMIERGYLKYDNVHVAIDPEFHVCAGHDDPGIPIGTVEALQINEAQDLLDRYVEEQHLRTKKILIAHQFGDPAVHDGVPYMIRDKKLLRRYPNVELVINMDGLGEPAVKVNKYNRITDSASYPFIQFRGIKIFYRDPGEVRGHFDKPPMTVEEIFGVTPVPGRQRMAVKPDVVIIA
jgi:hypothetical protein